MATSSTPRKAAAKKAPAKRIRRTQAQIAADKAAAEKKMQQLAEERAADIPAPKKEPWERTVHFLVDGMTAFGKVWYRGEQVTIKEDTAEFKLAFDSYGNFIFNKTPEEQLEQWGEIRYAPGPWTGEDYDLSPTQETDDGTIIQLDAKELALLKKANEARH